MALVFLAASWTMSVAGRLIELLSISIKASASDGTERCDVSGVICTLSAFCRTCFAGVFRTTAFIAGSNAATRSCSMTVTLTAKTSERVRDIQQPAVALGEPPTLQCRTPSRHHLELQGRRDYTPVDRAARTCWLGCPGPVLSGGLRRKTQLFSGTLYMAASSKTPPHQSKAPQKFNTPLQVPVFPGSSLLCRHTSCEKPSDTTSFHSVLVCHRTSSQVKNER
ncbi:hypothetical protein TNCV_4609251 [Trichonephila clavipes]|nr:hypothetical protein TNCV_4609251 [Trichonephila clavipes]